ncbi:MAG: hypothetical protein U0Y68_25885 [Blastocatellia bacterium]
MSASFPSEQILEQLLPHFSLPSVVLTFPAPVFRYDQNIGVKVDGRVMRADEIAEFAQGRCGAGAISADNFYV